MTPASRLELSKEIRASEGFREKPYLDCCGKYWRNCVCAMKGRLTISYGRNLDDVGISALEAEVLLDHDLASAEMGCRKSFPWFADLSDVRQRVIVDMAFNLGLSKLRGFHRTLTAIANRDYASAAVHMLASKWAAQVGNRAVRLAKMMRDGK